MMKTCWPRATWIHTRPPGDGRIARQVHDGDVCVVRLARPKEREGSVRRTVDHEDELVIVAAQLARCDRRLGEELLEERQRLVDHRHDRQPRPSARVGRRAQHDATCSGVDR